MKAHKSYQVVSQYIKLFCVKQLELKWEWKSNLSE